jgi:pyridoxine 5-phosphate synthase
MTRLSVNINKIALLRNARGRNYPDVAAFAARCLDLGAHGITLHPRPDERHARLSDLDELSGLCRQRGAELNVEGYPSEDFLGAVLRVRPDQCTLVPDQPGQLTSDHGWDLVGQAELLAPSVARLAAADIRVSLFVDHDCAHLGAARELGAHRVELYTEPYAAQHARGTGGHLLGAFRDAAQRAHAAGLGVNAGHDLSLANLADFLTIPGILEVSIGHALIVECLEWGVGEVVPRYLEIVGHAAAALP